jgi:hypothetical protein
MENQMEKPNPNLLTYSAALYAENKTYWEVKEALEKKGVAEELAEKIAEQSQQLYTNAIVQKSKKNILWGSVWFVGGLLIAFYSISSGGGSLIICFSAIFGGVIQLISGLVQRSSL